MTSPAKPLMIFHVPYRLNYQATAASGIRPVKMRQAFEAIGFEVLEVAGTSSERRQKIAQVKALVRAGARVEFVYSESSTQANAFTDPYFSLHPFFDNNFLAWCRRRGMKVGLFYRDVYWQFSEFSAQIGWLYATALRFFYRLDLLGYRAGVDKIYLPSMRMAEYISYIPKKRCEALPPASEIVVSKNPRNATLFYVGGLGSHYRLHEAVRGVGLASNARLILCALEKQWAAEGPGYKSVLTSATRVVQGSGAKLETFYKEATFGCLFLEPIGYREFAAPFKLFEYLGHGKPIIATQGTLAGEFVEANGIGWALPYEAQALADLLDSLKRDPKLLEEKIASAERLRSEHTWEARARQVATGLARA